MSDELKKDNRIIPFLLGLFMGWAGVRLLTHLTYITIIILLIATRGCGR